MTPGNASDGLTQMGVKYEDNYGFWTVDLAEELAFFEHVQNQSIDAVCERCKLPVRLLPAKTIRICASCVSAQECGAPVSLSDY